MATNIDFDGHTALITGAASGIGAACAYWLDAHDIKRLILVDTDRDGLEQLELRCKAIRVTGNVADPDLWTRLEAKWDRVDHAIVNAGIGGGGELADHSFEDWRRVMDVNCDGAFLTLSAALRAMRKRKQGSAVVVSSVTGIKPVPSIGAYGVAKAGIAHMARIAAAENAQYNIRVNAIAPGGVDTAIWDTNADFRSFVDTKMDGNRAKAIEEIGKQGNPLGRFSNVEEIAAQIGFLLSDSTANLTGQVLVSDGGYSL